MPKENEPVVIYSGNIVEADLVKSFLEAEGVMAFLQDQHIGSLVPFLGTAVKVSVPARDFRRAQEIVNQFLEEDSSEG